MMEKKPRSVEVRLPCWTNARVNCEAGHRVVDLAGSVNEDAAGRMTELYVISPKPQAGCRTSSCWPPRRERIRG